MRKVKMRAINVVTKFSKLMLMLLCLAVVSTTLLEIERSVSSARQPDQHLPYNLLVVEATEEVSVAEEIMVTTNTRVVEMATPEEVVIVEAAMTTAVEVQTDAIETNMVAMPAEVVTMTTAATIVENEET